jgi:hypothetical protein
MASGVSRMSLPETEEFKAFQVSMEGQQESPGAFEMSAFALVLY